MAKAKIATSRKRVVAKLESDLPDEVMTHLSRLGDHLSKHWMRYLVVIALIMVGALAIQWFVNTQQQAKVAAADEVGSVFVTLQGTVATDIKSTDDPTANADSKPATPDFDTRQARAEDVLKKVEAIGDGSSDTLTALAQAAAGRAEMDLKKWSEASQRFAKSAENIQGTSLALVVLESQGRAAQASGALDEARRCYKEMAGSSDLYYQVRGHVLLGDLENPNYNSPQSEDNKVIKAAAAKARDHYKSALAALVPVEGHVLTVSLKALRSDLNRRKALLP